MKINLSDRIDIDENKFCLSNDIPSPKKNNALNFPFKSYLLIQPLTTITSRKIFSILLMSVLSIIVCYERN